MTTSASICLICSSVTAAHSNSSTLTSGGVSSISPFSLTLLLSLCRTPGWKSLKMNLLGLQERQMVMPARPTPLPSSRTVLHPQRACEFKPSLSVRTESIRHLWSTGWPVGEGLLVIQSPLCQVKSSLPGHQASGPVWYRCYVFQQADSITAGLEMKSVYPWTDEGWLQWLVATRSKHLKHLRNWGFIRNDTVRNLLICRIIII